MSCYYANPVCEGELWVCQTCGQHYCQAHSHSNEDMGRNVECVACERARIGMTDEDRLIAVSVRLWTAVMALESAAKQLQEGDPLRLQIEEALRLTARSQVNTRYQQSQRKTGP
jgi:hypothetical protein